MIAFTIYTLLMLANLTVGILKKNSFNFLVAVFMLVMMIFIDWNVIN